MVEDRGAGVAEDERPFLFQKFRRGGAAPQHGPKGTGIGLFIVATLAERIGATARHRPAAPHGSLWCWKRLVSAPRGDRVVPQVEASNVMRAPPAAQGRRVLIGAAATWRGVIGRR